MSNRNQWISLGLLTLVLIVSTLLVFPRLSEPVAVHWNSAGQADGFGGRFMGVVFLPLVAIAVALLLMAVPAIDPLRKNIQEFRPAYNLFVLAITLFFTYLHGLTIAYNLVGPFNMSRWLAPAFGVLLYSAGVLIGKAKRNYMIGIRTPWTLASEEVWDATHLRGGVLFKGAGIISLLGLVFPVAAIWLLLVSSLCVTVYVLVYSYVVYRRLEQRSM